MNSSVSPSHDALRQSPGEALRNPDTAGGAAPLFAEAAAPAFKRQLVQALLIFVLACLVGVAWLANRSMDTANASDQRETHSRVVLQELGAVLSSLKDAETGQRGFIITGDPDYLAPYQASLGVVPIRLAELRRLTADNPYQQRQLDALAPLVEAKLAELKETIALRESEGFVAARAAVLAQSGKKIMDDIRALVAEAQVEEEQLLKQRVTTSQADSHRTTQSVLLGATLGGLVLVLLIIYLRWELARRKLAETAQQASEARYGSLFNSMDEGFCVIEMLLDPAGGRHDFRYREINPAFALQTGMRDVVGKRIRELMPDAESGVINAYAKVAVSGEPIRIVSEVKPLGRWFDIYALRLGGPGSLLVAVLFKDISESKKAEQALRESNEELTVFNRVAVDRELRMIALKDEVNRLCGAGGQPPRYNLAFTEEQP